MRSQATPQAASAQGAAPTATEQRARLLALLDQCHARDKAASAATSRCYALAPASSNPLDEPATDPARWQGFI
jgi:hypothetical protein